MNGIADAYGWLFGNNGNEYEPALRNLIKLCSAKYKAWEFANTRKGYWRIANSPILNTFTIERLKQAGYMFFTEYYRKVNGVN